jgi:3-methyladenine DNA glycosylase AlkD
MDLDETIAQLEALGTEQNRKTYRRHGVKGPQFGVSFANLDKLAKQLKKDKSLDRNALAGGLWASGIHDARMLAVKIADPAKIASADIDAWALDLDNYIVTDALGGLVGSSPFAREKMAAWVDSADEWISAAGWNILGQLAMQDESLPDDFFSPYLAEIAAQVHTRPNRTRYAMNNALIAIGIRDRLLEAQAMAAAKQVGVVEVDHGETSCKTPFAPDYIQKTWAHKEKSSKS